MSVHAKLAPEQQMTIDEFLAFTETRPDEERWELIEGRPVLNPSPIDFHQIVVANIVTFLMQKKCRPVRLGFRCLASAPEYLPRPTACLSRTSW
jgi:hypothetical protein